VRRNGAQKKQMGVETNGTNCVDELAEDDELALEEGEDNNDGMEREHAPRIGGMPERFGAECGYRLFVRNTFLDVLDVSEDESFVTGTQSAPGRCGSPTTSTVPAVDLPTAELLRLSLLRLQEPALAEDDCRSGYPSSSAALAGRGDTVVSVCDADREAHSVARAPAMGCASEQRSRFGFALDNSDDDD